MVNFLIQWRFPSRLMVTRNVDHQTFNFAAKKFRLTSSPSKIENGQELLETRLNSVKKFSESNFGEAPRVEMHLATHR